MTRQALLIAVLALAPLGAADLVSHTRRGNLFQFHLSDGRAELEWVNGASFRYSRWWDGPAAAPLNSPRLEVVESQTSAALELRTRHLTVEIARRNVRITVRAAGGQVLMAEAAEARRQDRAIIIEQRAREQERFYGLGPDAAERVDRRGEIVETSRPFLISTAGYGQHFASPGRYVFDVAKTVAGRLRVTLAGAGRLDYFFYYGPTPKEILEQHMEVEPISGQWSPGDLGVLARDGVPAYATRLPSPEGTWEGLAGSVRRMIHASLSGLLVPVFDVGGYRNAPPALAARALKLGAVAPMLVDSTSKAAGQAELRRRLARYLEAYFQETRDRGLPILHPLPLQFPRDPEAPKYNDEFTLGDELLVAPLVSPSPRRAVYLPMGTWTDLRSNVTYPGRRVIEIESPDALPLFAKNGSIVPLEAVEAGAPLEIHYFPSLGAEFFLFEREVGDHTQLHASPAGDFLRLEIESKVDRVYHWVAHHTKPPALVAQGETRYAEVKEEGALGPGAWRYDARRGDLHVVVDAPAGEDVIVNVTFPPAAGM